MRKKGAEYEKFVLSCSIEYYIIELVHVRNDV